MDMRESLTDRTRVAGPRSSRQFPPRATNLPSMFWRLRQGSVASFEVHSEGSVGDGHPFLPLTASDRGMRCAPVMLMVEREALLSRSVRPFVANKSRCRGEDDRVLP
jgi:hypothetical protein